MGGISAEDSDPAPRSAVRQHRGIEAESVGIASENSALCASIGSAARRRKASASIHRVAKRDAAHNISMAWRNAARVSFADIMKVSAQAARIAIAAAWHRAGSLWRASATAIIRTDGTRIACLRHEHVAVVSWHLSYSWRLDGAPWAGAPV